MVIHWIDAVNSIRNFFWWAIQFISGTYSHKTGTRPPSCVTPQRPTIYDQFDGTSIIELSEGDNVGDNDGFLMIWGGYWRDSCPWNNYFYNLIYCLGFKWLISLCDVTIVSHLMILD